MSIALTYFVSAFIIPVLGGDSSQWWKLATIISCGTLAGAVIPELVKVFTSTESRHVKEVVTSAQEGGASLGILSGFVAGNFSAYYLGITMVALMSIGYLISNLGLASFMLAPPVFAFGLVAFGFLGMGPVTIAVDSYGPVTDNAQSVYELSLIEQIPNIASELKKDYDIDVDFERAKHLLEANDGAGNTFKATAKPVLIGTAVVGATTMIFSIIMALTNGLTSGVNNLSLLHAPVRPWADHWRSHDLLVHRRFHPGRDYGRLPGRRVHQGPHQTGRRGKSQRQRFEKGRAKSAPNTPRRACSTFSLLSFSLLSLSLSLNPSFSSAISSPSPFSASTRRSSWPMPAAAWDNAKKIVEVELKQKGTPLHDATVIGDTVGDPFKDTSSVALNPVIKFTTLFGLLAVELAVKLTFKSDTLSHLLALGFFVVSFIFVYRSFFGMRIKGAQVE